MDKPILLLSALLLGMGMFNWKDMKMILDSVNNWFNNGDPEIVYPVAIITGLLVAAAASWVMM